MQEKRQLPLAEIGEFSIQGNKLSFTLSDGQIEIEFVGDKKASSRENIKALVMDAYAERVKKWQ